MNEAAATFLRRDPVVERVRRVARPWLTLTSPANADLAVYRSTCHYVTDPTATTV